MKKKEKEKQTQRKEKLNLLTIIERVAVAAKNSKMNMDSSHLKPLKEDIAYLARSFDITPCQVVLFCVLMECGPYRVDFDDLSTYLGVSHIRALSFGEDVNALIRRRIARYHDIDDEDSLDVPGAVIKSLKNNEVFEIPSLSGHDCYSLMSLIGEYFAELCNNRTMPSVLADEMIDLLQANTHLEFARQILEMRLCDEDLLILLRFSFLFVNNDDNNLDFTDIYKMFESRGTYNRTRNELRRGNHRLMREKLIEHFCDDGMADCEHFKLTDYAKRTLLKEFDIPVIENKVSDLIYPESIKVKDLFFPEKVNCQVKELSNFLCQEQYVQIRQRMKERGFHSGFACLFYGPPGTGKTETAYQLARFTGRAILMVDMPEIKSKWVGESEKNVKAIFERYRQLVKHCELAPILLFNEADGIIGIRKNAAENALDKMENTVQNIILQEMENIDGILIATTNLVDNLDTAFERRFLYKIHFEKPDSNVRRCIWHKMIPQLNDDELGELSASYDFSGGQIENVARKHSIYEILYGEQAEGRLEKLKSFCESEWLNTRHTHRKIGY